MQEIVAADLPIICEEQQTAQVVKLFVNVTKWIKLFCSKRWVLRIGFSE